MAHQLHIEWLEAGRALLVRCEGVLDLAATRRVVRLLVRLRGVHKIVLDLANAQLPQDRALALLAPMLAVREAHHVIVRGLSRHQERVLRYLGLPREA